MNHEPLGFVSDALQEAQLDRPSVGKKGYAVVVMFQQVEQLL